MNAINPTMELAKIRNKIDIQQQVISELETTMQELILGDDQDEKTIGQYLQEIRTIYDQGTEGQILGDAAFFSIADSSDFNLNDVIDQEFVRQLLYQARALLGQLRQDESFWNQEAQAVKSANKELIEQAKA